MIVNMPAHKPVKFIPVDEFKTIEVLKGEEAIEKYGEKARNGLINIIKKTNKGNSMNFR